MNMVDNTLESVGPMENGVNRGGKPGSEWTGLRGRIGAWYLNSLLRRFSEIFFLGDCKSAFLNELSRITSGNEVVLDIGAGSGYFSLVVAKRLSGGRVICLDLSEEMLRRLERNAGRQGFEDRVQILKGEASSVDIQDESIDIAVSNGVFHELSNPNIVLREMHRVLKPNGWVIVTDFRDTRVGRRIAAAHREGAHGPFSVDELATLLIRSGLRDVKVYPVKHWVIGMGMK